MDRDKTDEVHAGDAVRTPEGAVCVFGGDNAAA